MGIDLRLYPPRASIPIGLHLTLGPVDPSVAREPVEARDLGRTLLEAADEIDTLRTTT